MLPVEPGATAQRYDTDVVPVGGCANGPATRENTTERRKQQVKQKPLCKHPHRCPLHRANGTAQCGLHAHCHIGLLYKVARSFKDLYGCDLEINDLVQEGYIALQSGLRKFDPARGCTPSTYGVRWIMRAMRYAINADGTVRDKGIEGRKIRHRRAATEEARAAMAERTALETPKVHSLDQLLHASGFCGHDAIPADQPLPDTGIMRTESRNILFTELHQLPERTRHIVFNVAVLGMRYEHVGAKYGICRERVRQIWRTAQNRLQRRLRSVRGAL
jgi:RNA polymerase sigma factor (sigma-70 family)